MIEKILNNSVVFGKNRDKLEILKALNKESLFLNLTFYNNEDLFITFNHHYYFYMNETYGFSLDLAKKIQKYIAYIDVNKIYQSSRLNELAIIKKDLLQKQIIELENLSKFKNKQVYSFNGMPLPSFFEYKGITDLSFESNVSKDVNLFVTETSEDAAYKVHEEVVSLLEEKVSIDDIVILNTTTDDDFLLTKIFNDSKIPLTINKPIKLNKYPAMIEMIRIIKSNGFKDSKEYLNGMIEQKVDSPFLKPIIQIYNNYTDSDLSENTDILVNIINSKSASPTRFKNCLNIYQIDDFKYESSKHYIIMNYHDNSLPKKANISHYLNEFELEEINYIKTESQNKYLEKYYEDLLSSIENLTLIFSSNKEEELRLSRLNIHRKINQQEYTYIVKDFSYLNALNQLEFAKTRYDLETFYIQSKNYNKLYNTYHQRNLRYLHEFNGISQSDLNILLKRNHSITPYKLESYHKCQFQFLLQNLLEIEAFEPNINQYLGNLSHKVLEELTIDKDVDYTKVIDHFEGFPEDIRYKETIFKEAIKKEMNLLVPLIKDFHMISQFKTIKPEIKFRFPFKHDEEFDISGIIDKVMIKENKDGTDYFVLIDYKLSSKDFKIEDFNKNLKLQLPMYLYAYRQLNQDVVKPLGFFYQTTALGRLKAEPKAITNNFSLKGVALENETLLEAFNPDLTLVKGISLTKSGSLSKSKRLLSDNQLAEMENQIEEKIIQMIQSLKEGKFDINPLPSYGSSKDSESCKYCQFNAICYNKNKKRGGTK